MLEKRQSELEAYKSGKQQKDKEMALLEQEVRQKIITEYKQQADQYVLEQIALRQAELQSAFEMQVQQEAGRRSLAQSQMYVSYEFDVDGEVQLDDKLKNGIASNLERSQIRRRNAKAAKVNTIGNQSEMGDSDMQSQFSAMDLLKK